MLQIAADLWLGVGQEQKRHERFSFRPGSDTFEPERRIFAHDTTTQLTRPVGCE
jgi:hypothetical protein